MLQSLLLRVLLIHLLIAPATSRAEESSASTSASTSASANEQASQAIPNWGIGFSFRMANIPFKTDEKTVATLIPLVYFEGDRFFFRLSEGGFKFYTNEDWEFSVIGRRHFFDIPAEFQNEIQGDTVDYGLQALYRPWRSSFIELDALTDDGGHSSGVFRVGMEKTTRKWILRGIAEARAKTRHYNSNFWGLRQETIDGGVDLTVGLKTYYHVISSLYVHMEATSTFLDKNVRRSDLVDNDFHNNLFLGFAISDPPPAEPKRTLRNRPYVRLAHCWATPSSLADIIALNAERDPGNNQLSTIFYGHPVSDRFFGLPFDIYLHSGFGWHWKSPTQSHTQEVITSIKLYYTIPLPLRVRLGFAEGLSYVSTVPSVERDNLSKKGYETSKLLNYLDPSLEISLEDILPWEFADGLWLGYYIHHRSAIFNLSQQFARIKGGSNFQSLSLQWHW